jgi:hypothetical protein
VVASLEPQNHYHERFRTAAVKRHQNLHIITMKFIKICMAVYLVANEKKCSFVCRYIFILIAAKQLLLVNYLLALTFPQGDSVVSS